MMYSMVIGICTQYYLTFYLCNTYHVDVICTLEKLIVVQGSASHELTDPSVVQNPHGSQRLNPALAQRSFATTDFHISQTVRLFIKLYHFIKTFCAGLRCARTCSLCIHFIYPANGLMCPNQSTLPLVVK